MSIVMRTFDQLLVIYNQPIFLYDGGGGGTIVVENVNEDVAFTDRYEMNHNKNPKKRVPDQDLNKKDIPFLFQSQL